ncbi:sensor histidine kinase [Olsenella profusa]|nr:sensor histidine kinase [Olsenella profusa]
MARVVPGDDLMTALAAHVALLAAYAAYVRSLGRMRAPRGAWAVALSICACALACGWFGDAFSSWALTGAAADPLAAGVPWGVAVAWGAVALTLTLMDAFFDEEPFSLMWVAVAAPGVLAGVLLAGSAVYCGGAAPAGAAAALVAAPLWLMFVLAMRRRGSASLRETVLLACVLALCSAAVALGAPVLAAGALVVEFLVYLLLTGGFERFRRGFESSTERFQQEVLSRQYDEIRSIYLDMRGWRHDYHNHLQVMKAQLAAGQLDELSAYLDELESDLDRVDTYVKSGNLMVDAILNSKLSLAERDGVEVTCKATVPDELAVDDVDLCVILGNLLDNAIEACEKIDGRRWLRVYVAARGAQLYASIQNSAVEDPSFNQRNYISEKRGNHGLGMKRVAAVVDKYEGYLNLANEPGVFAAEVSLPL